MKFGFVGCGQMARYHAEVVVALGHSVDIVCSRTGSPRRDAFCRDFGVGRSVDRLEDLARAELDAVVVAVEWDATADIAEALMRSGVPCLIEKPVALTSERIAGWLDRATPLGARCLVGYNRRFYDFIPEVRQAVSNGRLVSVEASFPDSLRWMIEVATERVTPYALPYLTSHYLDLLRYLLGELRIETLRRFDPIAGGGHRAYNGLFLAVASETPVHLQINFDAPSRHRLALNFERQIIELSPIETMTVYDGLEQLAPTPDRPIRRYAPKVAKTQEVGLEFKPGVRAQLEHFVARCVRQDGSEHVGCTIAEAYEVARLCEAIDGRRQE
ncbi:MAG: hypothetical protein CL441_06255 [Acidimicrobiaceae bacterium]|nr:hypothetical protein [Acidimicrobiaceae bacterium]